MENKITELFIEFLEGRSEEYKKQGFIPTIELIVEDLKKMLIKNDKYEGVSLDDDIYSQEETEKVLDIEVNNLIEK